MKAGNEIVIGPNVHIQAGADFHAYIGPCTRSGSNGIVLASPSGEVQQSNTVKETQSDISIYPNPNNGTFEIEVKEQMGVCSVRITDTQGKLVFSKDRCDFTNQSRLSINVGSVETGIYIVQVEGEQNNYRSFKKLIIE